MKPSGKAQVVLLVQHDLFGWCMLLQVSMGQRHVAEIHDHIYAHEAADVKQGSVYMKTGAIGVPCTSSHAPSLATLCSNLECQDNVWTCTQEGREVHAKPKGDVIMWPS